MTDGAFPSMRFVDLVRGLWWLGDSPPAAAPTGWNEAAELRDLRTVWRNFGGDAERVETVMRGFRTLADRGELPGVTPHEGFTGGLLKRLRGGGYWGRAEHAGRALGPERSNSDDAPADLVDQLAGRIGHG